MIITLSKAISVDKTRYVVFFSCRYNLGKTRQDWTNPPFYMYPYNGLRQISLARKPFRS